MSEAHANSQQPRRPFFRACGMCVTLASASLATRGVTAKGRGGTLWQSVVRVLRLTSGASPGAPPRAPVPGAAVERRVCHSLTLCLIIMLLYRALASPL